MSEAKMAFTAHLKELRKRLIISCVAALVGFSLTYTYSIEIFEFLLLPLKPALPKGQEFMVFTSVTEPFFTYLKVGILSGIIAASPVILYQVWAFVAPGLYENEKRIFLPAVLGSALLFLCGVAFAYFVVFPLAFKYLLGFASPELKPLLSISVYFSMATKLLLAFGIVFQLPLAILVLSIMGIVDAGMLIRYWKYALVVNLIVSAILTPPDVFSQVLMAVPLMALYVLGIILAKLFGKKSRALEGAIEAQEAE